MNKINKTITRFLYLYIHTRLGTCILILLSLTLISMAWLAHQKAVRSLNKPLSKPTTVPSIGVIR